MSASGPSIATPDLSTPSALSPQYVVKVVYKVARSVPMEQDCNLAAV